MYLSKIRIENYKSFFDSGEIEFKPGINIIVGQNNSGKTALLEALELKVERKIHESEKTKPLFSSQGNVQESFITSEVIFKANEVKEILCLPEFLTFFIDKNLEASWSDSDAIEFQENIGRDAILNLENKKYSLFTFGVYQEERGGAKRDSDIVYLYRSKEGKYVIDVGRQATSSVASEFTDYLIRNIYRFYAERTNISFSAVGIDRDLKPNASNLAEVLNATSNFNPALYQEFVNLVNEVIPSVKGVTATMTKTGEMGALNYEIKIWTIPIWTQREDLTKLLSDSGTGVGQVLAILYVVVTSKQPKIIIIDEPNSFLHPGATKKLIEILTRFPQHQYFISTHSPEIVTAANPATITMLNYVDGETEIEQIDLSNASGVKKVFKDLGIEPATFAFANNILWVEGLTEEKAFSLILKNADIHNVVVKPTVPSEFRQNKKRIANVRHIFKLHETISGTDSVISPKMTIVLDKEIGKEKENDDLIREFGEGKFNFIPRAMYENYLLNAEAITYVLKFTKETENFKEEKSNLEISTVQIEVENVETWIEKNHDEFLPDKYKNESEWQINVDGAKLLDKLFKCFLGQSFGYERYKVEYGEKLTHWLLENKPAMLDELKNFLLKIISGKDSP